MNIKDFVTNKKLFLKYCTMIFVSLFITIIFSSAVINKTRSFAEEQIKNNGYQSLKQVQIALDREFVNIRKTAMSVTRNKELSAYVYNSDDINSIYRLSELVDMTNFRDLVGDFVLFGYIYMKDSDLIICEKGKFTPKEFYAYLGCEDETYQEWYRKINGKYYNTYAEPINITLADAYESNKVVPYFQSFPLRSFEKGNLVIFLDYNKINQIYGSRYSDGKNALFVLDKNNKVVFSFGDESKFDKSYSDFDEKYTSVGRDLMVFKRESQLSDVTYISVEEKSFIREQLKGVTRAIYLYILVVILICITIPVIIAHKFTSPVVGIYRMLKGNNIKEPDSIAEVVNSVKKFIEEKDSAEISYKKQKAQFAEQSLTNAVIGLLEDFVCDDEGRECLEKYFTNKYIRVITAELADIQTNEDCALLRYAVKNVGTEVLEKNSAVYALDYGWNKVIFIINYDKDNAETIMTECEYISDVFADEFGVTLNMGIGKMTDDIQNMSTSFASSGEMLEGLNLSGERIGIYENRRRNESIYYFTAEHENMILKALVNSDSESASEVINKAVELHKTSSPDIIKCLHFHLIATVLKLVNDEKLGLSETELENLGIERLFTCEKITDLTNEINSVFAKICSAVKEQGNSKKDVFKTLVMGFVDEHYGDNGMSLDMVASAFNVHPTYISHFFKDTVRKNFTEYVTEKRISRACELLETGATLNDIAISVGYANSTVLVKKFKKVMGVTPGEYRKSIK